MAIEIAGGVYCPLSPRDPEERLHMLVKETKARVVVVHWLTGLKFCIDFRCLSMDTVLSVYETTTHQYAEILSAVKVSSECVAYTIFTSGSTGTPKAVSVFILKCACLHVLYFYTVRLWYDIVILLAVSYAW